MEELLKENRISMFDLARVSDVNYSTLHAAKKRGGQLSVDTIISICDGLGIRPFEFFMSDGDWETIESYVLAKRNHRVN